MHKLAGVVLVASLAAATTIAAIEDHLLIAGLTLLAQLALYVLIFGGRVNTS